MKKIFMSMIIGSLLCAGVIPVSAKPIEKSGLTASKLSKEDQMRERERKNAIKSIKVFSKYTQEELERLTTLLENMKANTPLDEEGIRQMQKLVDKQQQFVDSEKERLRKLEAMDSK